MTPIKRQLVEFKCTNSSTFLKKTFYYRLDKSTLMLGRAKGPKTSSLMVKECVRASKVFVQAVCAAELFVKIPTGQYIIALDKSQFFSRKEPFLELLHLGSPKTHTWHATTHTSFFS